MSVPYLPGDLRVLVECVPGNIATIIQQLPLPRLKLALNVLGSHVQRIIQEQRIGGEATTAIVNASGTNSVSAQQIKLVNDCIMKSGAWPEAANSPLSSNILTVVARRLACWGADTPVVDVDNSPVSSDEVLSMEPLSYDIVPRREPRVGGTLPEVFPLITFKQLEWFTWTANKRILGEVTSYCAYAPCNTLLCCTGTDGARYRVHLHYVVTKKVLALLKGASVAVADPFLTVDYRGYPCISVTVPSDVVITLHGDEVPHFETRERKDSGDVCLSDGNNVAALERYLEGLRRSELTLDACSLLEGASDALVRMERWADVSLVAAVALLIVPRSKPSRERYIKAHEVLESQQGGSKSRILWTDSFPQIVVDAPHDKLNSVFEWLQRGERCIATGDYSGALAYFVTGLRSPKLAILGRVLGNMTLAAMKEFMWVQAVTFAAAAPLFLPELKEKCAMRMCVAARQLGFLKESDAVAKDAGSSVPGLEQIDQQRRGEYDWEALWRGEEPVAEYCGPVQVRLVEGKGRGLFATQSIPAGTVIVCSRAISSSTNAEESTPVFMRYGACIVTNFTRTVTRAIAKASLPFAADILRRCYNLCNFRTTSQLLVPDVVEQQVPFLLDVGDLPPDCGHITEAVLENAFECETCRPNDCASGLFYLPSFVNHSALPNASRLTFGSFMVMIAQVDIAAGAEIEHRYFPLEVYLTQKEVEVHRRWNLPMPPGWVESPRDLLMGIDCDLNELLQEPCVSRLDRTGEKVRKLMPPLSREVRAGITHVLAWVAVALSRLDHPYVTALHDLLERERFGPEHDYLFYLVEYFMRYPESIEPRSCDSRETVRARKILQNAFGKMSFPVMKSVITLPHKT